MLRRGPQAAAAKASAAKKAAEIDEKHDVSGKASAAAASTKAAAVNVRDHRKGRCPPAALRILGPGLGGPLASRQVPPGSFSCVCFRAHGRLRIRASPAAAARAHWQAKDKARDAMYGNVATVFNEFDADGNGYLDKDEVGAFCVKLGLKLTEAELAQAILEMDADEGDDKDGQITLAEFFAWWQSESATKARPARLGLCSAHA